jgi:ribose 5-phosphate isomerase RpiB
MKIALIIENSQAAKSETVHAALTAVAEPLGHEVFHYGMYTARG